MSLIQVEVAPERYPNQPLFHLDILWIQVIGNLCNLTCTHCFVSAGPENHTHPRLSREEVRRHLADAARLGAREVYFTGGEPFLHPELIEILGDSLEQAPCTVLTNGTLFTRTRVEALRRLTDRARYSLELRVSLDGSRALEHDAIRGPGTFARTLEGLRQCSRAGLLAIVTVIQPENENPLETRERYDAMLRGEGIERPRFKLIPMFRLGRAGDARPDGAHSASLADLPPEAFDPSRLQCGGCRAVTGNGVYVCPLLVEEPEARMGAALEDSLGPYRLKHGACVTCYATGMTCGNG